MAEFIDDEYLEEGEEGEGQTGSKESSQFAQLRKQLRETQKRAKANEAKAAEYDALLAKQTTSERVAKTSEILTEMGLNPKHAALFHAINGVDTEPTAEAVARFALDNELGVPVEKVAEVQKAAEGPKFVPVSSGNAIPVSHTMDRAAYTALKKTDPAAAALAVKEHRVDGFHYDADVTISRGGK